jgi:hypothetical protein
MQQRDQSMQTRVYRRATTWHVAARSYSFGLDLLTKLQKSVKCRHICEYLVMVWHKYSDFCSDSLALQSAATAHRTSWWVRTG